MQEPVGFWDPAGFTADGSVEDFKRRRQTELKHGRISMLATMGYITPETLRFKDVFAFMCMFNHLHEGSRRAAAVFLHICEFDMVYLFGIN